MFRKFMISVLICYCLLIITDIANSNPIDVNLQKTCAILYAETYYRSIVSELEDLELLEQSTKVKNFKGTQKIKSVRVKQGCKITICAELNNLNLCYSRTGNISNLDIVATNFISTYCSCIKNCQCKDVEINRNIYGRVYSEGGCDKCETSFIELKAKQGNIPYEIKKSVNTLVLRTDCNATVYPEPHQRGDPTIISGSLFQGLNKSVSSYSVNCHGDKYQNGRKFNLRPVSEETEYSTSSTGDNVVYALMSLLASEDISSNFADPIVQESLEELMADGMSTDGNVESEKFLKKFLSKVEVQDFSDKIKDTLKRQLNETIEGKANITIKLLIRRAIAAFVKEYSKKELETRLEEVLKRSLTTTTAATTEATTAATTSTSEPTIISNESYVNTTEVSSTPPSNPSEDCEPSLKSKNNQKKDNIARLGPKVTCPPKVTSELSPSENV